VFPLVSQFDNIGCYGKTIRQTDAHTDGQTPDRYFTAPYAIDADSVISNSNITVL